VEICLSVDEPTEVTTSPKPTNAEIDFILNEVSHYLNPDIMVRRGDVLAAWSGIRPLVRNPKAKNTQSLVRSHLIDVSDSGLLTVGGGKWTTYRKMAEEAVDKAIEVFHLKPLRPCQTEDLLLIGTHGYKPNSYIRLIQHFGLETEVAQHLLHNYGDRAFAVATLASKTDKRWPIMGMRLSYPYLFIEAEVRYAVHWEFACTAVDVLGRRTRLAFLNAQAAFEALPRVIEIMAEELGWDKARCEKEHKEGVEYLDTMGLNQISSRSRFKSDEIMFYRHEFHELDLDGDGVINTEDLKHLFQKTAAKTVTPETLQKIIEEVKLNQDGVIGFDEFLEIMMSTDEINKQPMTIGYFNSPRVAGGGV
jgi:glycerol-3-phosphate dehydrogenase